MSNNPFYHISRQDKQAIYNVIAEKKGMTPFAVEKDWWVSRTLEIIFSMEVAEHMVFKGGTSLSKAWKLIHRFSEDIDLAIDRAFFDGFTGNLSKNQKTALRKKAGKYTTGAFFEELQIEFKNRGYTDLEFKVIETKDSDRDPRIIEIYYPNVIEPGSDYIFPRVQVEISCRSLREPFIDCEFGSFVDEEYAGKEFASPLFKVPTVTPERTFLEKIFLLHEEFHRPEEKMRVDRLSRHLYDVYQLSKAGIADKAIKDNGLYESIVKHRHTFSKVGGVDYNTHNPLTVDPTPIEKIKKDWEVDYAKMLDEMIYEQEGEEKPTFQQLLENLDELKTKLAKVEWAFSLTFELPKAN